MLHFLIASFFATQPLFADNFKATDGKGSVKAYANWGIDCFSGRNHVYYVVYDNQTDQGSGNSCALTSRTAKCKSGDVTANGCPGAKWGKSSNRTILATNKNHDACLEKAKKLKAELEKKKYVCTESGIG